MRRDFSTPAGTVHRLTVESSVLKGNLLGDPTDRIVDVYVPHGHDGRGLPLLVVSSASPPAGRRTPTGAISRRTSRSRPTV